MVVHQMEGVITIPGRTEQRIVLNLSHILALVQCLFLVPTSIAYMFHQYFVN